VAIGQCACEVQGGGATAPKKEDCMLSQLVIGSGLLLTTTLVHALFTNVAAWAFFGHGRTQRWHLDWGWGRFAALGTLVIMMFFASLIEASIWAVTYVAIGALSSFEPALYFSIVTFTTLGYGDVTLHADWRLLASFEGANGTIMFGWTTAIIVALVHTAFNRAAPADPTD
jgi:hypothetical protein